VTAAAAERFWQRTQSKLEARAHKLDGKRELLQAEETFHPRTRPGRPRAFKRPQRFPQQTGFVWHFCMGAQGA
jgi:hypothetical protein